MASYTGNYNLKKPATTDNYAIADSNGNMDIIDTALNGLDGGIAIVSNNNTHAAASKGQYLYVRRHGSLAEGLYKAKSNIAANATLSTSNVEAVSGGLGGKVAEIDESVTSISGTIGTVPSGKTVQGQISTISGQIETYDIGSVSQSDLESAIVTLGSEMAAMQVKNIRFALSPTPSSGAFSGKSGFYMGAVKKHTTNRLTVEAQCERNTDNEANGDIITGAYYNSAWLWRDISNEISSIQSQVGNMAKYDFSIPANGSVTINFSAGHTVFLAVSAYNHVTARDGAWLIWVGASTVAGIHQELKSASSITVTEGNRSVTFANSTSEAIYLSLLRILGSATATKA